MDAFQRALQKDPSYAPAMAGLAMSVLLLGEAPNDAIPPSQALPQARQYAYKALEQNPANSDAYCVLANFAQGYDHDLGEAERLYKKAIDLDPGNVTALKWYSDYLFVSNRLPEASKQIDKALELDPASPLLKTAKAEVKYYARDFDATLAQAQRTVDQYPEFILAHFWLGSAYRQKKMFSQAIQEFDELRKRYPNNAALLMAYGHALGLSGDRAGAQKILKELLTQSHSRYVPSVYIAGMYTSLGNLDQAFHWLDKAYDERSDRLVYLGVDPIADPLRADPRFAALMRKVGLH
jgi:serine/threonine-protein kinase